MIDAALILISSLCFEWFYHWLFLLGRYECMNYDTVNAQNILGFIRHIGLYHLL